MALEHAGIEGIPNIVLIGMPNMRSLVRVERKLQESGISHFSWHEPDYDMGFTAIATVPLRGEIRKVLANYRLYQLPRSTSECALASKAKGAGISPAGVAMPEGGRHLTSLECDSGSSSGRS